MAAETGATADTGTPSFLRRALVVAALSRVLLFVTGVVATEALGFRPVSWAMRYPRDAEPFTGLLRYLLNPWAHWDGVWYIKIAINGYTKDDGSVAFFPLFPTLLRYAGVLFGGNLVVTGIVVSLACFFVAVVLLYRLVEPDFGHEVAYLSVVFLCFFPTSFFLQAVYTESFFLMLSLACFLWSRQGRWKLAGFAGLLATLTRSTGVMLLIPMLMYYYEGRGWRWRATDARIVSLVLIPEGLLVWMAYLSLGFQKPLLFAEVQDQWRRTLAAPGLAVGKGLWSCVQGIRQMLSGQSEHLYWPAPHAAAAVPLAIANLINFGMLLVAAWAIIWGARRLPQPYTAYALATVAFPLFFPSRYMPLMSTPRFVLAAFPVMVSLAVATAGSRRRQAVALGISITVLLLLTGKFAVFSWVA